MRTMLLIVGWILVLGANYFVFLALELYWNWFDWVPRFDLKSLGLLIGLLCVLVATWELARVPIHRVARIASFMGCLALFIIGAYVLPEEPKTAGLFSRESPSPLWYRGGRFMVMSCPSLLWAASVVRSRRATHPV